MELMTKTSFPARARGGGKMGAAAIELGAASDLFRRLLRNGRTSAPRRRSDRDSTCASSTTRHSATARRRCASSASWSSANRSAIARQRFGHLGDFEPAQLGRFDVGAVARDAFGELRRSGRDRACKGRGRRAPLRRRRLRLPAARSRPAGGRSRAGPCRRAFLLPCGRRECRSFRTCRRCRASGHAAFAGARASFRDTASAPSPRSRRRRRRPCPTRRGPSVIVTVRSRKSRSWLTISTVPS